MAGFTSALLKLQKSFTSLLSNFKVPGRGFNWTALIVSGLVLSYCFVENSVAGVLIFYITDSWKNENLPKAAIVVNFEEGLSAIMTLVIAHFSDAYIGRFRTVALTTFVYIIGIMILSVMTSGELWIFYAAAVLIAFGRAGKQPPLKAFLADQNSMIIDNVRVEARTTVWWRFVIFLGSAFSIIITSTITSWVEVCRISVILMVVTYMIFWSGFSKYNRIPPTGSPLTLIYKVFKAATLKRHFQYPKMANQFFENDNHEQLLSPNIPILRFLDKAAIVEDPSPLDEKAQVNEGKLCTANQVSEVKQLLRMVPMWTTFLVYGLVQATGSTFFFSQTNNLNDQIWNGFEVPVVALLAVTSLSNFLVCYLISKLIRLLRLSEEKEIYVVLLRIGAGMACAVICCFTAFLVEVRRLHLVNELDDPDNNIDMSIFWLTPQFILLGLMEGLAEEGLNDLLYNHIAPSMDRYGPPFNEFVLGIGYFLSILFILGSGSWFGDNINESRLDKYFFMLAILNILNLCLICYVCSLYAKEEASPGNERESNDIETPENDGPVTERNPLTRHRNSRNEENSTMMAEDEERESNDETPENGNQVKVRNPITRRRNSNKERAIITHEP